MNNALLLEASAWAKTTFADVRLGDKRRSERAVRIATQMATESGASLPRMMKSNAELKAAYRFLETPDVTYEALIRPHMQQTREQAQSQSRVLLIQDTTDLKYSHHPKTKGLGPLKNQKQHGMLLQSVLAVDPEKKEVFGIMHQEPFLRKLAPEQETQAERGLRESGKARSGNARRLILEHHQKESNGFMLGIAAATSSPFLKPAWLMGHTFLHVSLRTGVSREKRKMNR